ncbi:MAG: GNAT family N-acetyltransferase [Bacteroidales bacterium]|jgi:hypothetical protein|nr:GNAT family N-acetyltransferase [Bacteroidales bacterium]
MLQVKKLQNNQEQIEFSKNIYEKCFPIEERRDFSKLIEIYNNDLLELNLIYKNNEFVGILNYWQFPKFLYIEHFAIDFQSRNQKIASNILAQLNQDNQLIILEVELPIDEISKKRIQFYERAGFLVLPYEYSQPAYRKGEKELPMHIMTNAKRQIKEYEYQEIISTIRKKVYEKFW